MADKEDGKEKDDVFKSTKEVTRLTVPGRLNHDEFDQILLSCMEMGASDITIVSDDYIWCDISGKQKRVTRRIITYSEVTEIVKWVYGSDNGPGEVNSGHDLDPSYEIKVKDKDVDRYRFRVNITGGRIDGGRGAQLTIRTLPPTPIEISRLDIEQDILDNFRPPQGLILITGPTGSGKSTLMSSLVRWRCEQEDANEKIIEYSKPIEFVYTELKDNFPSSHVFQTEVGFHLRPKNHEGEKHEGSIWSYAIRNAMRRKPTAIILGEARDAPTIQGCIEASLTGHLVVSTMHTIGVPETVRRSMQPFPAEEKRAIAADFLECIHMVVTQVLLQKKGDGTSRIGCREYMVFDRRVKAALVNIDPDLWPARIREMIQEGFSIGRSMSDHARMLLEQDLIEPETYEWIASRTASESKVVRDTIGRNIEDLSEDI